MQCDFNRVDQHYGYIHMNKTQIKTSDEAGSRRCVLNFTDTTGKIINLLKPQEVADTLGVSLQSLYDWHYRKAMPGLRWTKVGRQLRMHPDVLRSFIESRTGSNSATESDTATVAS